MLSHSFIAFTGGVSQDFSEMHLMYLHLLNHIPCCVVFFTRDMWNSNLKSSTYCHHRATSWHLFVLQIPYTLSTGCSLQLLIIPWLQSHANRKCSLQKWDIIPLFVTYCKSPKDFKFSSIIASFLLCPLYFNIKALWAWQEEYRKMLCIQSSIIDHRRLWKTLACSV